MAGPAISAASPSRALRRSHLDRMVSAARSPSALRSHRWPATPSAPAVSPPDDNPPAPAFGTSSQCHESFRVIAHNRGTPYCAGSMMLCPRADQASAHERNVSHAVTAPPTPRFIQQQHARVTPLHSTVESPEPNRHMLQQRRTSGKPLRMPRRQRIITAPDAAPVILKRFNSTAFPSTVLPHTSTGPAPLRWRTRDSFHDRAGAQAREYSNFKFPATRTPSALAPISCSRAASSAVWRRNRIHVAQHLRSSPRNRR